MPPHLRSPRPSPASLPLPLLLALVIASAFRISGPAYADEVLLKNGKLIEGEVVEKGDRVTIRPYDAGAAIVLGRDRIESIRPKPRPVEPRPAGAAQGDAAPSAAPEATAAPAGGPDGAAAAMSVDSVPPELVKPPPMPEIEYSFIPLPDAQIRTAVESVFPRMVRVCVEELGMTFDGHVRLNIEIIHDTRQFQALETAIQSRHASIEGFYIPQQDKIVVRGDKLRMDAVSTLYHEASHALIRRELIFPPSWVDEGLAEFFEGFRVHGRKTNVIDPGYSDAWAKKLLLTRRLIPLREYFMLSNPQWNSLEITGDIKYIPRIMAWSLVTFLLTHEEGRMAFQRYVRALKENQTQNALAAAYKELDTSFPGGIRGLEESWHGWIRRTREPLAY